MDTDDLINRFKFHPATPQSGPKHDQARSLCLELALKINDLMPEGREKSLAVTELERVMFWVNAGIARGQ